jgi:acyl-homoserine lactone acylase PvdQ
MLAMEFYELAKQSVQYLDEEDAQMIDAYVNGVNDFI